MGKEYMFYFENRDKKRYTVTGGSIQKYVDCFTCGNIPIRAHEIILGIEKSIPIWFNHKYRYVRQIIKKTDLELVQYKIDHKICYIVTTTNLVDEKDNFLYLVVEKNEKKIFNEPKTYYMTEQELIDTLSIFIEYDLQHKKY